MDQLTMAGHLIRRLQQISVGSFQQLMQEAGYDITSVQFAAMQVLLDHPGADQARIAEMIDFDRATIGDVLSRLERKGYIARTVSEQDRRSREVRLTQEGSTVIKKIYPQVEALQKQILKGLNDQERKQFLNLARKVVTYESTPATQK